MPHTLQYTASQKTINTAKTGRTYFSNQVSERLSPTVDTQKVRGEKYLPRRKGDFRPGASRPAALSEVKPLVGRTNTPRSMKRETSIGRSKSKEIWNPASPRMHELSAKTNPKKGVMLAPSFGTKLDIDRGKLLKKMIKRKKIEEKRRRELEELERRMREDAQKAKLLQVVFKNKMENQVVLFNRQKKAGISSAADSTESLEE